MNWQPCVVKQRGAAMMMADACDCRRRDHIDLGTQLRSDGLRDAEMGKADGPGRRRGTTV